MKTFNSWPCKLIGPYQAVTGEVAILPGEGRLWRISKADDKTMGGVEVEMTKQTISFVLGVKEDLE